MSNKKLEDKKTSDVTNDTPTRNRRGKRQGKRKQYSRKDTPNDRSDRSNDPSWYAQSAELLRDSSSIPFSWPVGTSMQTSPVMALDTVPGICALSVVPTIGTSINANAPVNVAASAIYSWVRHANSGHANYDATDLMIYLLAMSNVYSNIVWMQRLYGYAFCYDQRNRYLPRALAAADGVDFDDIRNNLADFRYFLNNHISKVASLAVPATMPIFSRLAFLFSNVYCEGPSVKDQMYMFTPDNLAWYKFGLNSQTGVGELVMDPMQIAGTKATVAEIKAYATSLFNAIWEQEDFGIMSGDILKAYDGNIIKLATIPEVMNFTPVYDALVLHQMKNAKVASLLAISKISQSSGIITQSITIDPQASAINQLIMAADAGRDKVLSTNIDGPGPDVVIESTRLMYAYDPYGGVIMTGTELCTKVKYVTYDDSGVLKEYLDFTQLSAFATSSTTSAADLANILMRISIMCHFKYHPEKVLYGLASNAVTQGAAVRVWDIDNYAVLSNNDLMKMHEAALLSLFAVPAIAKIS